MDTDKPYDDLCDISDHLNVLIKQASKYYRDHSENKNDSEVSTSLRIAYGMALDFYLGIVNIGKFLPQSAGVLARSLMEVHADMNHIHRDANKQVKRARSYVKSVDDYAKGMIQAAKDYGNSEDFSIRNINPWTTSSIEDRIKALGPEHLMLYDYFSVYTHANPGSTLHSASNDMAMNVRLNTLRSAIVNMWDVLGLLARNGILLDYKKLIEITDELRAYAVKYPADIPNS
jgi:hypothetical protein